MYSSPIFSYILFSVFSLFMLFFLSYLHVLALTQLLFFTRRDTFILSPLLSDPPPPPPNHLSVAAHFLTWHDTLESSPTTLSPSERDAWQPVPPVCLFSLSVCCFLTLIHISLRGRWPNFFFFILSRRHTCVCKVTALHQRQSVRVCVCVCPEEADMPAWSVIAASWLPASVCGYVCACVRVIICVRVKAQRLSCSSANTSFCCEQHVSTHKKVNCNNLSPGGLCGCCSVLLLLFCVNSSTEVVVFFRDVSVVTARYHAVSQLSPCLHLASAIWHVCLCAFVWCQVIWGHLSASCVTCTCAVYKD